LDLSELLKVACRCKVGKIVESSSRDFVILAQELGRCSRGSSAMGTNISISNFLEFVFRLLAIREQFSTSSADTINSFAHRSS
jgi:hypothetical protein